MLYISFTIPPDFRENVAPVSAKTAYNSYQFVILTIYFSNWNILVLA